MCVRVWQVFLDWRAKQIAKRQKKDDTTEAERKRKGILTGREIFAEVRVCAFACDSAFSSVF